MPQGFVDSPVVYSIVLNKTLCDWQPPCGSTLLQYVDDLLLCSRSEEDSRADGISLLKWLCSCGHKVSQDKVQWCKSSVQYLGFVLSKGTRSISPERVHAIMGLVTPSTKKEMLNFLEMVNFF